MRWSMVSKLPFADCYMMRAGDGGVLMGWMEGEEEGSVQNCQEGAPFPCSLLPSSGSGESIQLAG